MGCLKAIVSLASEKLKVRASLICTPNTDVYLKVAPTEIEIPVDGSAAYINVYTNTNFKFR